MTKRGLSETRLERRYEVQFDAVVATDWQQHCEAEVTNLSQQGIRLEGARELVDKVFPNFNPPKGQKRSSIGVVFYTGQELDQPAGRVEVSCQTVYVRRVAPDRYQIGMQFVEIHETSLALLEELVPWLERHGRLQPAKG